MVALRGLMNAKFYSGDPHAHPRGPLEDEEEENNVQMSSYGFFSCVAMIKEM